MSADNCARRPALPDVSKVACVDLSVSPASRLPQAPMNLVTVRLCAGEAAAAVASHSNISARCWWLLQTSFNSDMPCVPIRASPLPPSPTRLISACTAACASAGPTTRAAVPASASCSGSAVYGRATSLTLPSLCSSPRLKPPAEGASCPTFARHRASACLFAPAAAPLSSGPVCRMVGSTEVSAVHTRGCGEAAVRWISYCASISMPSPAGLCPLASSSSAACALVSVTFLGSLPTSILELSSEDSTAPSVDFAVLVC
mmetsp:Transcript_59625/g.122266  ORF Transcript_59625/g.122266 Transcript_59625/m.122266 type:complete len:259 (-) Transcript_59625:1378-2154(-)